MGGGTWGGAAGSFGRWGGSLRWRSSHAQDGEPGEGEGWVLPYGGCQNRPALRAVGGPTFREGQTWE